jgi:hypothetical protein
VRLASSTTEIKVVRPAAIKSYFDAVHAWAARPISSNIIAALDKNCLKGCEPFDDQPCRFGRREYHQRLELKQPQRRALRLLARLDVVVNYVEVARDWIYADTDGLAPYLLDLLFKQCFLQPWHDPSAGVEFYPCGLSTRRTPMPGERKNGHWFQGYGDKGCRLPEHKDAPCYHFEGRHAGVRFVRRFLRIRHPRALLTFDFDAHFSKSLRLYQLDFERLARYHLNRESSGRRQRKADRASKWPGITQAECDMRLGALLYRRHCGRGTLQEFVDSYRPRARPFLKRLRQPPPYYVHRAECTLLLDLTVGPAFSSSESSPSPLPTPIRRSDAPAKARSQSQSRTSSGIVLRRSAGASS